MQPLLLSIRGFARQGLIYQQNFRRIQPIVPILIFSGARMKSTFTDYIGNEVVANSQTTVDSIEEATFEYVGMKGNPVETIEKALAIDTECALGHCVIGIMMCISTCVPLDSDMVAGSLEKAQALLHQGAADAGGAAAAAAAAAGGDREEAGGRTGGGDPRGAAYAAALAHLAAGRPRAAANALEAHLSRAPLDLLALRVVHDLYILSGDSRNVRDSVARVLPFWTNSMPGYGFVLGMYAFGLEENGDYRRAEENAQLALGLGRGDVWAAHALAHVYEMEGRANEGASWLREMADVWEDANLLQSHMAWHNALYYIDQGNYNAALRIFGTYLEHAGAAPGAVGAFPLTDSASLLWRLRLCGALPPGAQGDALWQSVLRLWEPFRGQHLSAFNDLHIMMCLSALGTGESEQKSQYLAEAEALLESMECYAAKYESQKSDVSDQSSLLSVTEHSLPFSTSVPGLCFSLAPSNAWVTRHLGLPAARGLLAFAQGDHGAAADALWPLRAHHHLLGSSHAQRDFLEWTLIDACLGAAGAEEGGGELERGGSGAEERQRLAEARVLLAERTLHRGGNAQAWARWARALALSGDPGGAEAARLTAYQLGLGQAGQGAH